MNKIPLDEKISRTVPFYTFTPYVPVGVCYGIARIPARVLQTYGKR